MSNDIQNEQPATAPDDQEDNELKLLLAELGIDDTALMSDARIAEIASADPDAEKRELAERLLQLQLYVKKSLAIGRLSFKTTPPRSYVFNPVEPLDKSQFVFLSDLKNKSDTSGS